MAQLVERSFPTPEIRIFTYNQLFWKDENVEKRGQESGLIKHILN